MDQETKTSELCGLYSKSFQRTLGIAFFNFSEFNVEILISISGIPVHQDVLCFSCCLRWSNLLSRSQHLQCDLWKFKWIVFYWYEVVSSLSFTQNPPFLLQKEKDIKEREHIHKLSYRHSKRHSHQGHLIPGLVQRASLVDVLVLSTQAAMGILQVMENVVHTFPIGNSLLSNDNFDRWQQKLPPPFVTMYFFFSPSPKKFLDFEKPFSSCHMQISYKCIMQTSSKSAVDHRCRD